MCAALGLIHILTASQIRGRPVAAFGVHGLLLTRHLRKDYWPECRHSVMIDISAVSGRRVIVQAL